MNTSECSQTGSIHMALASVDGSVTPALQVLQCCACPSAYSRYKASNANVPQNTLATVRQTVFISAAAEDKTVMFKLCIRYAKGKVQVFPNKQISV